MSEVSSDTARGNAHSFPLAVVAFVSLLTLFAGALAYATRGHVRTPSGAGAAALVVLLFLGAYLIVHFRMRDHADALDLFEAAIAPTLFAFAGPVAIGLVAVADAAANAVRRNAPIKSWFNVAASSMSAGVASIAYLGLRHGSGLTGRNMFALVASMLVYTLVNQVAFVSVLALSRKVSIARVLTDLMPVIVRGWVAGWLVNVTFGTLFAITYHWRPAAVVIGYVPMLLLSKASRALAESVIDQARLRGRQRAAQALALPIDPRDAIPAFLNEVRHCFDSESVELWIEEDDRLFRHVSRVEATTVERAPEGSLASTLLGLGVSDRITTAHDDPGLVAALIGEGHRDCIAAPLVDGDRVFGILCSYDRNGLEGFEEGELAVLETLAGDLTAALRKGELLREMLDERRKLAEIVTQSSDGIMSLGSGGKVLTWNPALEAISGFTALEMTTSRTLRELTPCDSAGRDVPFERWRSSELPVEVRITARDGGERWLACSYARVEDATGHPMLIVVARDSTRTHEIEQMKDDFVATITHELRTPLTPLKAWASMLLTQGEQLEQATRAEGLATMLRQTERLEELITNLLDVSRVELDAVENSEVVMDLSASVAGVVQRYQRQHPDRTIRLVSPDGTIFALGDERSLARIVANVLSNAVKFSPETEPIDVVVRALHGTARIDIVDLGPGIPASEMEKIFSRFGRLGDHLTRPTRGAGLGLYIARRVAQAMGSDLTVSSVPGSGSTFSLVLPLAREAAAV